MKKNDYVLVTGGTLGIGAGIVDRLIEDGYRPIVLDIAEPSHTVDADFFRVDLSDTESTSRMLAEIVKKFQVYRLVNNVGMVSPALLEDTRMEDFQKVMMLNAQTALLCIQALLPAMRKAQFGRVVSISSRTILGKEMRTAYSASKGAVSSMTRTWALELASDGITVNAVAPGPIGTEAFNKNNPPDQNQTRAIIDRIPVQRLGKPEDVAQAVSFFLDEKSGFITGQTLYVCGGITVGLSTN